MNTIENIFALNPTQLKTNLGHILERQLVPFVVGNPGV